MMTIRYNKPAPDALTFSGEEAACLLYNMITGTSVEKGETVVCAEANYADDADKFVSLKELCAVLALEVGDEKLGCGEFFTSSTWPFEAPALLQTVPVSVFLDSLFDYGLDAVKISPLRLLHIASRMSSIDGGEIKNEHVFAAACAFYCSFDERFQSLFYPASYCLKLASNSACMFELSSAIAKSVDQTKIYNVSPTSLWLSMLVQEPVPSLLYDFLSKTKQNTGVNDEFPEEVQEEIGSMADVCHHYINEIMPLPVDLSKVDFTEPLLKMVSDVISTSPASVKDIVAAMFECQGKDEADLELWGKYCESVEVSCDFSEVPLVYYPDYIVLSPSGLEAAVSMLSDRNVPIRRVLASSALVSFLMEYLEGGAPDLVRLYEKDIASGSKLIGSYQKAFGDAASDEDLEIIQNSRKLSHFGVPTVFQQVIIANMISRNSSIVAVEDLVRAIDPQGAIMLLSNDVSPFASHAGIDRDAAKILAFVESVMRRMSMTMMMDQKSAMRLYASFLATAIATYQAFPDCCCSQDDQWIMSTASAFFDPRQHVYFSVEEREDTWVITADISSAVPALQTPSNGFNAQANAVPALSEFCTDMVALAREGKIGEGVVGRDDEIALVETILTRRDKSNPLLLAPAGAGKSAIVESIAWKIAHGEANLLNSYNLYQLDLSSLIADGCSIGVMSERLEAVIQESIETNTILFIDEIHMIVSVGNGELNVGNVMKPYLARGGLKLIGATTEREYNYTIAKDKALARRFSSIHLPALSFDALLSIINEKKNVYGRYHGVTYEDRTARSVAQLAKDYMLGRESPDRELDILDTSASIAQQRGDMVVEDAHIIEAVRLLTSNKSVKTTREVAAELVSDYTKEKLDEMFPNVAGQYEAKEKVARKVVESKLDISARNKPKNLFMFVGESGVGKTYMAHEMASLLDIDDSDVMTLNLGEFQDHSHTRLLGASPQYVGYNEGGVLTNFLKAHPHGIVVFDEFDKSHPSIQNVLLGMFDNGELQAGDGSIVDCKSATFICTANTGYGVGKKNTLGFASAVDDAKRQEEAVMDAVKEQFGAALLSRLDEIVLFDNLTDDDMMEICRISYKKLSDRLSLRHEVDLKDAYTEEDLEQDVQEKLSEMKSDEYDARAIWNEIEKKIVPKAISLIGS